MRNLKLYKHQEEEEENCFLMLHLPNVYNQPTDFHETLNVRHPTGQGQPSFVDRFACYLTTPLSTGKVMCDVRY